MYGDTCKFDHRMTSNQQVKEIISNLKKINDDPLGFKQGETNKSPKK